MSFLWVVLIFALFIPVLSMVLDSPLARALAGRIERNQPGDQIDGRVEQLMAQLQLMESELDGLRTEIQRLREEQDFTNKLLQRDGVPRQLPPAGE